MKTQSDATASPGDKARQTKFLLFPAIDLMGGCVVRLQKGDPEQKTVYSDNPPEFAVQWESAGADWIHIVDLDAAFSGRSSNLAQVRRIVEAVGVPCQLGGGMREERQLLEAFDAGVTRVILGTSAVESPGFLREMVACFGSDRIVVGIDARDGRVATHGWRETSGKTAVEFAQEAAADGAGAIVFTDIATDGMLQGPNIPSMVEMARSVSIPVIASGGVSSKSDLKQLADTGCLGGAIIGKALYEKRILPPLKDFRE